MWEVSNWQPEHRKCSNASAQAVVIAKAKAEALRDAGVFPLENGGGEPPHLPAHTHQRQEPPFEVRDDLTWASLCQDAPDWLQPYLEVPEDASPPLAISGVHPRAVGSYGAEAIAWVRDNMTAQNGKPLELRWWQRLAFVMQLQHDAAGALLFRTVIESGPRRVGKSVRLRSMALWRLDNADLFGEPQLVIHTGKDVAIVREIHRQAWAWATEREGWLVRKGVGQEEVITEDVHRWLVRSTDSVYGYDVCLGMVDEAWAVSPETFNTGLEPATMERLSPQLLLTSTAHRKATSLMRSKLSAALAADDGETLLMLWMAPPGADPGDEDVWRAASPFWSADRARQVKATYLRALAGEVDPQADDPDPVANFISQYLNTWLLHLPPLDRGESVATEEEWSALETEVPLALPDNAAIESWFSEGVSLALAWRIGDLSLVKVTDHETLEAAVGALQESGYTRKVIVGASLLEEPALKGVSTEKGQGQPGPAVAELSRLLAEGVVAHDGSEHLTGQVMTARTQPSPNGPRLISRGRADAIKAAVWASNAARRRPGEFMGMVLSKA